MKLTLLSVAFAAISLVAGARISTVDSGIMTSSISLPPPSAAVLPEVTSLSHSTTAKEHGTHTLPVVGKFVTTSAPSLCEQPACITTASNIPMCGQDCIRTAASKIGCPDPNDFACICGLGSGLKDNAQGCVMGNCGGLISALEIGRSAVAVCDCLNSHPATTCANATAKAIKTKHTA